MWPFNRKPLNPKDNPRKWIKRHYSLNTQLYEGVYIGANVIYKDHNNREIDMTKFYPLYVQGDKLKCCNIHDGDVILCSTFEYLESIHAIKDKPIGIFSDGNLCQISFMGGYDTPFEEVWKKVLDCKGEYIINKEKEDLKEEISLLIYDKNFEDEYIVAFKYVWSEEDNNYKKEWYIYFRSELIGIVKYSYKLKI